MRASVACRFACAPIRKASPLSRLASTPLARYVSVSEEVQDALHRSQPIVSLETAITSHGLPYDKAITVAASLDAIIRKQGAVPAVIGLIDGIVKVGLSDAEIQRLAGPPATKEAAERKWKVGKRDISPALVKKVDGGTTVSATSFLSHLVGIETFVTGGIGGVHRGAQDTMDISSDLTELGRTPVAVVCAGAKSILDIGLTLEYLETLGVTVTTFGESKDFPAFYARKSGFQSPSNVRTAREAAEVIYLSSLMDTQTGTLIGVPIPAEYEEKSIAIQKAVEQAVQDSVDSGIAKRGKEVTPWILARVKELTGGGSVQSNIALIENNAAVGAGIAVELSRLRQRQGDGRESNVASSASLLPAPSVVTPRISIGFRVASETSAETPSIPASSLMVVGAAAVDIVSRPHSRNAATTAPGSINLKLGGVARNVHEAAFQLGVGDALLVAPVGKSSNGPKDPLASVLAQGLQELGASQAGLIELEGATPCVNMMLDEKGDLASGVASTGLVEAMSGSQIIEVLHQICPLFVCFDGNISKAAMSALQIECRERGISTVFEPTSDQKALRWLDSLPTEKWPILSHMAPNVAELRSLQRHLMSLPLQESRAYNEAVMSWTTDERFRHGLEKRLPSWVREEGVVQSALRLLPLVDCLWIKAGGRGLLVVQKCTKEELAVFESDSRNLSIVTASGPSGGIVVSYHSALKLERQISVVGGGDSLLGALLAGLISGLHSTRPNDLLRLVELGQRAAVASLSSGNSVGSLEELRVSLSQ